MAKHHPDLVFCRKQPGIGAIYFSIIDLFADFSLIVFVWQQLGDFVKNVSAMTYKHIV